MKTGKGQYNCGGYSNAEVDKLIAESNGEVDVAKRTAMLQQIEKILIKDAAYLPLEWQNLVRDAARPPAVESVSR